MRNKRFKKLNISLSLSFDFSILLGGYELNETLFSLLVTMAIWQQKKMEFQNWQQQILHFLSGGKKEGRIFQTFLPQQKDFTCPL